MKEVYLPVDWVNQPIRVVLAGVGGSGSEMLDGLVRLHMALRKLNHPGLEVTAYDPDEVSSSNIGRQRFYPGDEGQNKALLAVNRINLFNGLMWDARPVGFGPGLSAVGYHQVDLIITCVDKASVRANIGKKAFCHYGAEVFWLDMGNDDRTGQCVMGHFQGGLQRGWLPNVYDLYPELDGMDDSDKPSCSFEEAIASQDLMVNRAVADVATDLLWQWIRHGVIRHHGAFVEVSPMQVRPLPIDPGVWASMGWTNNQEDDSGAPSAA